MRICFVSSESLNNFNPYGKRADLFVFSFSALGEVDFEAEIAGRSEKLKDMAILSKRLKATVICGCYTLIKGIRHKSAAVADKGKIIGVADTVNCVDDKKFRPGAGLKLFDLAVGKTGIAVGEDIFFYDVVKSFAACGCTAVVCPFECMTNHTLSTVARAYSYVCGVNICVCADGYAFASSPSGNMAFATPVSGFIYDFSTATEYRTVERRQRGLFGL